MAGENKFKKELKARLNKLHGVWAYAPPTRSERGIPDLLVCAGGLFVGLELKMPNAKPDPSREVLQRLICDRINEAGGLAIFGVTPENIEYIVDYLIILGKGNKWQANQTLKKLGLTLEKTLLKQ